MTAILHYVGPTGATVSHPLLKAFKLGRGSDCDVALPYPADDEVCRIVKMGERWQIEDFGGRRTYVNDAPVLLGRPRTLADGDRIRVGDGKTVWFDGTYADQVVLEDELTRLRKEVARLGNELAATLERAIAAETRITAAESEAQRARSRAAGAEQREKLTADELFAASNTLSVLRGDHDKLQSDWAGQQEKLAAFEVKVADLEQAARKEAREQGEWRKKAQELEARVLTAEMQRDAQKLETDGLRQLLGTESQSRNDMRAVIDELQAKLARLEGAT